VLALELLGKVVDEAVVDVFAAKVGVAAGGLDLEDALLHGEEGDIEGAAAKVDDEDLLLVLDGLVQAVGNSSRGGLVDDTEDLEAGDGASVLGSLALRVVEAAPRCERGPLTCREIRTRLAP
jgi:hypothetical protein